MALTVVEPNPHAGANVIGNRRARVAVVTFDDSYPTGGEAFDPNAYGLIGKPEMVLADVRAFGADTTTTLVVRYDRVNEKLQAFQQNGSTGALTEVPDTCDLSTLVVALLIIEGDGS